ncbi:MAG: SLBB domain-containing protein [Gemmatimonadaceae bacterium]|nr:SLBB domain-containing protein [Gemmatimonadaceae bacterium]
MRLSAIVIALAVSMWSSASTASAQGLKQPLRSGDRVFVRPSADSASGVYLDVDADGVLWVPRVGAIRVGSVPADSVAAIVRRALTNVYRIDDAAVVPLRRLTVLGEVRKAGVYFLPVEATLRDAIAEAQGVGEIGNPDRLTLVRDGSELHIKRWMTSADGARQVASGDVLIIAREPWLKRNTLSVVSTFALLITSVLAARK